MEMPYLLQLSAVLGANGAGTLTFPVPKNEALRLRALRFTSTGAWQVNDIRDSMGQHYTNASTTNPIPSGALQNGASANIGLQELELDLTLPGGSILYIDIQDTSAAGNTVRVTASGVRTLP